MYGKSCREMVAKNGRFPAKTGGLESLLKVTSEILIHINNTGILKTIIYK